MKTRTKQFLDAYVAARRTERQITRQDAAWGRWVARARLAQQLGDERLAQSARRRALLHGEAAARLRAEYVEQEAAARRLEVLARAEVV
jgi:phage shock protein A